MPGWPGLPAAPASCPAFQAVTPKVATSLVSTVPGDAEQARSAAMSLRDD
jgi:hypothetical protein